MNFKTRLACTATLLSLAIDDLLCLALLYGYWQVAPLQRRHGLLRSLRLLQRMAFPPASFSIGANQVLLLITSSYPHTVPPSH